MSDDIRLYHATAHQVDPDRWECYVDEFQDVMFKSECVECVPREAREKIMLVLRQIEPNPDEIDVHVTVTYLPIPRM